MTAGARELIVCGSDEVRILDTTDRNRVVWRWRAADCQELPPEIRPQFKYTAECKPVNRGEQILIASSSDGVALVNRSDGRVLACATVPNAHSADLLPDGRVVVASSSRGIVGDQLTVFRQGIPMTVERRLPLPGGHGVVWDAQRSTLWALSRSTIRAYDISDWRMTGEWRLPEPGGHDLYPVPVSAALTLTTNNKCWLFDRDDGTFHLHPLIGLAGGVKSIAQHTSGRTVYVRAEPGGWWSMRLRFLNPQGEAAINSMMLYKARWVE